MLGKFVNNGFQNYLIFQPFHKLPTLNYTNNDKVNSLKSKMLSTKKKVSISLNIFLASKVSNSIDEKIALK